MSNVNLENFTITKIFLVHVQIVQSDGTGIQAHLEFLKLKTTSVIIVLVQLVKDVRLESIPQIKVQKNVQIAQRVNIQQR